MQKKVCVFLLLSLSTSLIGMDRSTQNARTLERAFQEAQREQQQKPAQQPQNPSKRERQPARHTTEPDDCFSSMSYMDLMPDICHYY